MKTIATDIDNNTQDVFIRTNINAFAGDGVRDNKINVTKEGKILVWDDISGTYTTCHSIGPAMQGKLRAAAARIRGK